MNGREWGERWRRWIWCRKPGGEGALDPGVMKQPQNKTCRYSEILPIIIPVAT